MEYPFACESCGKVFSEMLEGAPWDLCGKQIPCTHCGVVHMLLWDESYDPETGEEEGWFYVEKL